MRRSITAGPAFSLIFGATVTTVAQDPSPSFSAVPSPVVEEEVSMRISSPAFEDEGDIPSQFTCDGEDTSPPLLIEELPLEAVSLYAKIVQPDADDTE